MTYRSSASLYGWPKWRRLAQRIEIPIGGRKFFAWNWKADQPTADGKHDSVGAVMQGKLAHRIAEVILDRLLGDVERLADLAVAQAEGGVLADDLATPRALAIAHEVATAPDLADAQNRALLLDFDRVLGLDVGVAPPEAAPLPEAAAELLERRAAARAARDFAASDALRDELAAIGVEVRDTPDGQVATVRS